MTHREFCCLVELASPLLPKESHTREHRIASVQSGTFTTSQPRKVVKVWYTCMWRPCNAICAAEAASPRDEFVCCVVPISVLLLLDVVRKPMRCVNLQQGRMGESIQCFLLVPSTALNPSPFHPSSSQTASWPDSVSGLSAWVCWGS